MKVSISVIVLEFSTDMLNLLSNLVENVFYIMKNNDYYVIVPFPIVVIGFITLMAWIISGKKSDKKVESSVSVPAAVVIGSSTDPVAEPSAEVTGQEQQMTPPRDRNGVNAPRLSGRERGGRQRRGQAVAPAVAVANVVGQATVPRLTVAEQKAKAREWARKEFGWDR